MNELINKNSCNRLDVVSIVTSSFFATIGRGVTLPFLPLFLHNHLHVSMLNTGSILTLSMVAGVFLSVPSGRIAKYISNRVLLRLSLLIFVLSFIVMGAINYIFVFIICFTLITCAYSVYSTIIKCYISEHYEGNIKTRVFSVNYTFINIGWMIGPVIGASLSRCDAHIPFIISSGMGIISLLLTSRLKITSKQRVQKKKNEALNTNDPSIYLLIIFTMGIFFGSFVFGRFASCISQILMTHNDTKTVSDIISILMFTNATTVIFFQYITGCALAKIRDGLGFFIGTGCLILGLCIFYIADVSLMLWGLGMFIFSFGEVIFMPLQYNVIDRIAPVDKRVSYFSFQNLGELGGALNPVITGYLLTFYSVSTVFGVLILISLLCFCIFSIGLLRVRRQAF